MWLKRAPKNRRLAREFVLDVKLRSSQVRARRVRAAAFLLGGLFLTVACVCLAWRATEWGLDLLLYKNKGFAVNDLDVQTDGIIAPDQLRRWTGVQLGQNLFALDLGTVRRNLQLVSMIQSVSIEKVLPHSLHVRVTEREAVARLSVARPVADGTLALAPLFLDSDGYVILPLAAAQCSAGLPANDQLPTIIGINANEVQAGRRVELPQVRAALGLILAFQRSPMQGLVDIATVDASAADVLVLKTGQGSEVTFSLSDPEQQLLRWQAIFEKAQQMSKAIATLDLAVSNNIPATWIEASAVPPVPVKSLKPLRSRKKHV
jgi:cell division protein FtsQ